MHFITPNRHSGRKLDTGRLGEALGVGQNGLDVEKAEPGHRLLPSFQTERIGNAAAQHLVSATEADDSSALAAMREQIDVPAFAPQELQIGNSCLRPGQDHHRGVARQRPARPGHYQFNSRLRS